MGIKGNPLQNHKRYQQVYVINETHIGSRNYPATNVAIVSPTYVNFTVTLEDFKGSISWNHESLFFIVIKDLENSCQYAHAVLKKMQALNTLSAVYLCNNAYRQLLAYTFNPYSPSTTNFWKISQAHYSVINSWILFEHQLDDPYISK